MTDEADKSQRTEEATPKRLEEARAKGDAARSQEIITTAMLAAGALGMFVFAGPVSRDVVRIGAGFIDHPHAMLVDGAALTRIFAAASASLGAALAGLMTVFVAAAVLANVVQARPVFAPQRLKPKLDKISPLAGAKRLYGASALVNFGKGLAKLAIVGTVLVVTMWPDRATLNGLLTAEVTTILAVAQTSLLKLVGFAAAAMILVAGLDYAWARRTWKERLRMTREEVKRELRESEGDPQIRGRQRQLREGRARRRMLVAVKDATVLIMNPTHYAVALRYEEGAGKAPVCIAKGLDDLALRMKAEAVANGVPVMQNPPLARALHAAVDIDGEIPVEHYEAVAKVIGFVMARRRPRPRPS